MSELKSAKGRLDDNQKGWGEVLGSAAAASGGALEYHVWRPDDWQSIGELLWGKP
jgi:hypothetical protein